MIRNTGPEGMAGVRGHDGCRAAVFLQRKGIAAVGLDPKITVEALSQLFRLLLQPLRHRVFADPFKQIGHAEPGGVDIPLDLDQGDGRLS